MKVSIWFNDFLEIKKVDDPVRYIDVQDATNFIVADDSIFRSFADFLEDSRVVKWSKGAKDYRVIAVFTDYLIDPEIIPPLRDKSDLVPPFDIDLGIPNDNYVIYLDLGIFIQALNNQAFAAYNTQPFEDFIDLKNVRPSPDILEIGKIDYTLLDEYIFKNS